MPFCVVVTGLPKAVKKQKMVHFLKQFVFKKPPLKFWIEALKPSDDSSNEMIVSFKSRADAEKAAASLHDYAFQHTDQQIYILKSFIRGDPGVQEIAYNKHGPETSLRPVEHQRPYSPERSRSPHINDELSKIQLEIELTNRKRMLVEAEHKLLMEQKHLEMLQKGGPSAVNSGDEEGIVKNQPLPKKERKRPQDQSKPGENRSCKLYWPCRIIGKEMSKHVKKHVEFSDRPVFHALKRIHIKQRFTDILKSTALDNSKKTVTLYRDMYPLNTDETFVLMLRDMVRRGDLPDEIKQAYCNEGSSNADIETEAKNFIDPLDMPIEELSQDLDDWTEDGDTTN